MESSDSEVQPSLPPAAPRLLLPRPTIPVASTSEEVRASPSLCNPEFDIVAPARISLSTIFWDVNGMASVSKAAEYGTLDYLSKF